MVWLFSPHNAIAHETSNPTAKITAQSGLQNPTYIITRQQIDLSGRRTFGDLWNETIFSGTISWSRIYLDGRHTLYAVSAIPLVAIERVEIWIGSPSVALDNQATGGTVNIVLRDQFQGGAVQLSAERPTTKGADADQFSLVWGSELENGNIFMAAEHIKREQIRYSDREFLKAKWEVGGSFQDASGVSIGGNTAFAEVGGNQIARAIGDCDPEVYTGLLNEPGGIEGTGCGFPWANIAWFTLKSERNNFLVNARQILDDDRTFALDARVSDGSYFNRSAPAVDEFDVTLPESLATSLGLPQDVSLFHRFVANGNREDSNDFREFEFSIGLDSQITNSLKWNTEFNFNSYSASEVGNNYVLKDAAQAAIAAGEYDVANPMSDTSTHLAAVQNIEVQLTRELDWTNTILRSELYGSGFNLGGRDVDWTAGLEVAKLKLENIYDQHRQDDNVIGSALDGIDGEQRRQSVFTQLNIKPAERWNISLGLRGDRYSDVGTTTRRRIAGEIHASEDMKFRASWLAGSRSPSLGSLYSHRISHPSIRDPACGFCRYQVKAEYLGNPNLEPIKVENYSLGVSTTIGAMQIDADLLRSKYSNLPTSSAQAIVEFEHELGAEQLPQGATIVREGTRIVEMTVPLLSAASGSGDTLHLRALREWQSDSWKNQWTFDWTRTLNSQSSSFGKDTTSDSPRDQLGLTWIGSRENLSAQWSTFFISGFDNSTETHRYDEWITHNVVLEFNKVRGYDDLTFQIGVLNLENRGPPTDPTDPFEAGLTGYHSWLERIFFVSAKYRF